MRSQLVLLALACSLPALAQAGQSASVGDAVQATKALAELVRHSLATNATGVVTEERWSMLPVMASFKMHRKNDAMDPRHLILRSEVILRAGDQLYAELARLVRRAEAQWPALVEALPLVDVLSKPLRRISREAAWRMLDQNANARDVHLWAVDRLTKDLHEVAGEPGKVASFLLRQKYGKGEKLV